MATLLEDIKKQSDWIVKAFGADKLKLDYTIDSLKVVDKFFDLHSANGKAKPNGRLSQNLGPIIFSIGSYIGETIIRNAPGSEWVTNDEDPLGEVNVEIRLPDGTMIMPMQRAMKRFQNGSEDGIYAYGAVVVKDIAPGGFWDKTGKGTGGSEEGSLQPGAGNPVASGTKKWWQFWK